VYDFNLSGRSVDAFHGNTGVSNITDYFNTDDYRKITGQNTNKFFWVLSEIHDWPRYLQNDPKNWFSSILISFHLAMMPGIPLYYYGFEQGFNGNCNLSRIKVGNALSDVQSICNSGDDSRKRQDMFTEGIWKLGSALPSIDNLSYIGRNKSFLMDSFRA